MQQRSGQAQPIDGVGRLLKIRHLKAQSQPKWQGWGIGSSQKILLCPGWTDSGSLVCGFGVVKQDKANRCWFIASEAAAALTKSSVIQLCNT